jgi:hypothetical protein
MRLARERSGEATDRLDARRMDFTSGGYEGVGSLNLWQATARDPPQGAK